MGTLDFIIFHVGGKGGIGIVKNIAKWSRRKSNNVEIYIFEADFGDKNEVDRDKKIKERLKKRCGAKVEILKYCVSDHNGVEEFYINKHGPASSLFKMEPEASEYTYRRKLKKGGVEITKWKEHCETKEVKVIDVVTFNDISKNIGKIPDFLSMDAQGSELSIMKGASDFFKGDLLGVITEVEFREIYKGQPLFAEQDQFLRKNGFIFIDMFSSQKWFMGALIDNNLLTGGEVIYLRHFSYFINKYKIDLDILFPLLVKLGIISKTLGYSTYTSHMCRYIIKEYGDKWSSYLRNNQDAAVKDIYDINEIKY